MISFPFIAIAFFSLTSLFAFAFSFVDDESGKHRAFSMKRFVISFFFALLGMIVVGMGLVLFFYPDKY